MKKFTFLFLLTFFLFIDRESALTNITIKNETLSPLFDKNTYVYNVFVNSNTQIITINATLEEGEIVTGTGSKSLKNGLNIIELTSYKDGKEANYTLNITRGEIFYDKETSHLKNIIIEGTMLYFEKDKYYYELESDFDRLNINYELDNPMQTVKVFGDVNLTKVENIIKFEVTSENKKNESVYIIKVNKPLKPVQEKVVKSTFFDNSKFTDEDLEYIKYIIISIVLSLIIVLFYFLIVRKNKKYYYIRVKHFFNI